MSPSRPAVVAVSLAFAVSLLAGDAAADLVPFGKKIVPHALRVEGLDAVASHRFLAFDCSPPGGLDYCVLTDPGEEYAVGSGARLFALPQEIVKTRPAWRASPDGGRGASADAGVVVVSPDIGQLSGEDFFRRGHPRMAGPFPLARYSIYGPERARVKRVIDVLRVEGVRGKQIDARYVRVVFVCSGGQPHELPWDGQGDRPSQPCGEDPLPSPPPSVAPPVSSVSAPAASVELAPASGAWLWGVAGALLAAGLGALAFGVKKP